jgi:nucleoside-diphosphate-sugar epimerase
VEAVIFFWPYKQVTRSMIIFEEKFRPILTLRLFGDSSKVRALGWKPHIELEQKLKDILDYWLADLA